jgi:hypothetical protein
MDASWCEKNFDEVRLRLNRNLEAASSLVFGDYPMRVGTLVDIVVYGGLAHSNPQKAEIFESWEKSGIMGMVWAEFFASMRGVMKALIQLRTLNEQVLAVGDPQAQREPVR